MSQVLITEQQGGHNTSVISLVPANQFLFSADMHGTIKVGALCAPRPAALPLAVIMNYRTLVLPYSLLADAKTPSLHACCRVQAACYVRY